MEFSRRGSALVLAVETCIDEAQAQIRTDLKMKQSVMVFRRNNDRLFSQTVGDCPKVD